MTEDRMTTMFFEMFTGLPRQGPGDTASTLRALSLVPGIGPHTRVLNPGGGTGLEARVIAQNAPVRIVAIDNHQQYVEEFNREAEALAVAHRVEAQLGDMHRLDFEPGSFDLIWCEGSIYVVGFEKGLRDWHRLLAPGGHLALTDVCWRMPNPPAECREFWAQEYPAIRDVPSRLRTITECGYEVIGHFPLPAAAWWDDYYGPLQQKITEFRAHHDGETDAQQLADSVQSEIDMWHKYSHSYGYDFFVMRRD
ncbi:MAG: class I SAM-dependent methyltransferase [Acidobacteria bacterium]|nr:class I SAM-dependent methyltransferase [Acidobacteriota bacterium]